MGSENDPDRDYSGSVGEFVAKDAGDRTVTAAVLVPGREDRHGDIPDRDNVAKVAREWLSDYANVDVMHSFENVARPVESWVSRQKTEIEGKSYPAGTWFLSAKIEDSDVWRRIDSGELTAFSIFGPAERSDDHPSPDAGKLTV